MADPNDSPDLDAVMDDAEDREAEARAEREDQVREHNRRVVEAHQANAQIQAELADRVVAGVPVVVETTKSWWERRGHLVVAGFAGAASLWALEWSAHKLRQTFRGRR